MQDRVPVNPGRVLITPENGSAAFYATMARADNPTQEGTPLNKASLLKDATAALFGLGAAAVPDDVLGVLSPVVLHWWGRRIPDRSAYRETQTLWTNNFDISTRSSTYNWQYSDNIMINQAYGAVSLINATDTSIGYMSDEATTRAFFDTLKGHYVNCKNVNSNYIFYFPADIPSNALTYSNYGLSLSGGYAYQVTSVYENVPASAWDFLDSADRNAYPDNGVVDGYEYAYLGIPWQNARMPIKIATGSYKGTGTYGADNPNSLTFDFEPQLVVVSARYWPAEITFVRNSPAATGSFNPYDGVNLPSDGDQGARIHTERVTWGANSLSWYGKDELYQLNETGKVYYYFAIG